MKNKRTVMASGQEKVVVCASNEVWISRDSDVDEAIELESRQYLTELEESQKSDRMLVGWRPD